MLSFLSKKKSGKGTSKRLKKKHDPLLIRPDRDWVIFFTVGVIFTIIVIAVHAFIFYKITQGNFFSSEESVTTEVRTIDRKALSETLEYFRKKQDLLIENVSTPPIAPSPR